MRHPVMNCLTAFPHPLQLPPPFVPVPSLLPPLRNKLLGCPALPGLMICFIIGALVNKHVLFAISFPGVRNSMRARPRARAPPPPPPPTHTQHNHKHNTTQHTQNKTNEKQKREKTTQQPQEKRNSKNNNTESSSSEFLSFPVR